MHGMYVCVYCVNNYSFIYLANLVISNLGILHTKLLGTCILCMGKNRYSPRIDTQKCYLGHMATVCSVM